MDVSPEQPVYADGGLVFPSTQVVVNDGPAEYVLTESQVRALLDEQP